MSDNENDRGPDHTEPEPDESAADQPVIYNSNGILVDMATGHAVYQGRQLPWEFIPYWVTDGLGNGPWPGDPTDFPVIESAQAAWDWFKTVRPDIQPIVGRRSYNFAYDVPIAYVIPTTSKRGLALSCAAIINSLIRHDESFAKRQLANWYDYYAAH
jgi:hypothetical protein